jgi:hypothetical protein
MDGIMNQTIKMNGQIVRKYQIGDIVKLNGFVVFKYIDDYKLRIEKVDANLIGTIIGIKQKCEGDIQIDYDYDDYSMKSYKIKTFNVTRRYSLWQVRETITSPIFEVLPEQIVE